MGIIKRRPPQEEPDDAFSSKIVKKPKILKFPKKETPVEEREATTELTKKKVIKSTELKNIPLPLELMKTSTKRKRVLKSYEVAAMEITKQPTDEVAAIEESSRIAELEQLKEENERLKRELEEKLKQADETLRSAEEKAQQLIEEAKGQAEQIIKSAQEQAQQAAQEVIKKAYEEAFNKGYQEGLEKGYQDGFEKGFQETSRGAYLFKEELKKLLTLKERLIQAFKDQLLDLALEMAKAIVEREIKIDETIVWNNIMANIDRLKGREEITIWVNPEDLDYVRTKREELKAMMEDIKSINVMPDPKIERGGCIIESSLGTIDARISVKMEALRELIEKMKAVNAEANSAENPEPSENP